MLPSVSSHLPIQPLSSNIMIENLDKTKVTGVEQVDTLQDGVHNLAAGQVGQGGLLQPVGDLASKEGVNRAERQGRDENGGYVNKDVPGSGAMNSTANAVVGGGQGAAQGLHGAATESVTESCEAISADTDCPVWNEVPRSPATTRPT